MSTLEDRRSRLIVNGKAAANPALRAAVDQVRERGHPLDVRATWEAGDAARFAAEAAAAGIDRVIAAGGDGTINEVVGGLLQDSGVPPPAVGVVPFGTANDFATGCKIPMGDPLAALLLALEGEPARIDLGKVNDRFFVNVASAGFGAEVTVSTPKPMKDRIGGAAYALTGLLTALKMRPYSGKVIWKDGEEEGSFIFATIGNGCLAGGGFQVAPTALLDDGLLDVMAVPDFAVSELGTVMADLGNLGTEPGRIVEYRRVDEFELHCTEAVPLNVDGEPMLSKDYCFRVLSRVLPFVLPNGAPLSDRTEPA
jgi:lipid kinase YegS